jgi:hypothetical protein
MAGLLETIVTTTKKQIGWIDFFEKQNNVLALLTTHDAAQKIHAYSLPVY